MNKSTHIDASTRALAKLLKAQPNLLSPITTLDKGNGQGLADFMDAFIRRYSEHLQELSGDPSPK